MREPLASKETWVSREIQMRSIFPRNFSRSCSIKGLHSHCRYVDDVLAGRKEADNSVGRLLMDMMHSIPKMDNERFQEVLNGDMKDLLMVTFLTMITKAQLSVNEKFCLL